jgi:hypothetical protein
MIHDLPVAYHTLRIVTMFFLALPSLPSVRSRRRELHLASCIFYTLNLHISPMVAATRSHRPCLFNIPDHTSLSSPVKTRKLWLSVFVNTYGEADYGKNIKLALHMSAFRYTLIPSGSKTSLRADFVLLLSIELNRNSNA